MFTVAFMSSNLSLDEISLPRIPVRDDLITYDDEIYRVNSVILFVKKSSKIKALVCSELVDYRFEGNYSKSS